MRRKVLKCSVVIQLKLSSRFICYRCKQLLLVLTFPENTLSEFTLVYSLFQNIVFFHCLCFLGGFFKIIIFAEETSPVDLSINRDSNLLEAPPNIS